MDIKKLYKEAFRPAVRPGMTGIFPRGNNELGVDPDTTFRIVRVRGSLMDIVIGEPSVANPGGEEMITGVSVNDPTLIVRMNQDEG